MSSEQNETPAPPAQPQPQPPEAPEPAPDTSWAHSIEIKKIDDDFER
jgi:hypothetical protein